MERILTGTGKKPYNRALRLHYHLKETVSTLSAGRELSEIDGLASGENAENAEKGVVRTGSNAICGCLKSFQRVEIKVDNMDRTSGSNLKIRRKKSVVTSERSKYPSPVLYMLCCCCRDYFAAPVEEVIKSPVRRIKTFRRSSLVTLNDPALDAVRSQAGMGGSSASSTGKRGGDDSLQDMRRAVASIDGGETKQHRQGGRHGGNGVAVPPLRGETKGDSGGNGAVTLNGRGSRSSKTLAIARVTKHRDKAHAVLSELERSKVVDTRRCLFAFRACITGLFVWVPILALFYLFFTPVSVMYPTTHIFDLTHYLETTLDASIRDHVVDQASWYDWHQRILLGVESTGNFSVSDHALVKPFTSLAHTDGAAGGTGTQTSNVTYLLSENVILGPVSLVGIRAVASPCAYPGETSWSNSDTFALTDLVCYAPLDTKTEVS